MGNTDYEKNKILEYYEMRVQRKILKINVLKEWAKSPDQSKRKQNTSEYDPEEERKLDGISFKRKRDIVPEDTMKVRRERERRD